MLRNYLRIVSRSMMKNKVYIFINILGLALAIALSVIAFLNWNFRERFDDGQPLAQKIYRVEFTHNVKGSVDRYGNVPMPLAAHVHQNVSDVKRWSRFFPTEKNFRAATELFNTSMAYADSSFLLMFTFPVIEGTLHGLGDKSNIFISERFALKYFKKLGVVGREVIQIIDDHEIIFTVAGVFKDHPLNSSFYFDAIVSFENIKATGIDTEDWTQWNTTFLQIDDPTLLGSVTSGLQQFVEPQNKAREDFKIDKYYLQRFEGIAKKSVEEPRIKNSGLRGAMPSAVVDVPLIMAALLLLLACFNFTNTSIALSSQRLKEIALRKVMGSMRKQLVIQFLVESLVVCFLALTLGLLLSEFIVPAYDELWSWLELNLNYTENWRFLVFISVLLLLVAVIAGAYPAFYITSFEPVSILKGKTKFGGTSLFSRILLGAQVAISLITILFALGFYSNAQYQKAFDLGYYSTGVIAVTIDGQSDYQTFTDALSNMPGIHSVAGTQHHIVNTYYQSSVKHEATEIEVDVMHIGEKYLEAMDIRLLSGRGFNINSETDFTQSVIVSEEFVRRFNWKAESALGQRIVWHDTLQLYVVGVVKDLYARALFRPVEPMMLLYARPSHYKYCVVTAKGVDMLAVNEALKQKWSKIFPNTLYNSQFIDNKMHETHVTNNNVIIIFTFIGALAVILTGSGMYTLISLHVVKRTKEIGVRKVLGASSLNIIYVISFHFILIIVIGSFIGAGFGYSIVNLCMDVAWEYYEKVSPITFALALCLMLLVTFLSIGVKTFKTTQINPARTLRDE